MVAAGVAFLLLAAVSIKHLHATQAAAPYQATALQARVTLRASGGASPLITGRLDFLTPPNAPQPGQYTLIVIDDQTHLPSDLTGPKIAGGAVVRYDWDKRFDPVVASVAGHGQGIALSFAPDAPGPIAFATTVPAGGTPAGRLGSRVTVLLAFFSAEGRLYWSTKVPG